MVRWLAAHREATRTTHRPRITALGRWTMRLAKARTARGGLAWGSSAECIGAWAYRNSRARARALDAGPGAAHVSVSPQERGVNPMFKKDLIVLVTGATDGI